MRTMSTWIAERGGCREAIDWVRNVAKDNVATAIRQCPDPWWLQWLKENMEIERYGYYDDAANESNENITGFICGAMRALEKSVPRAVKANAKLTRAASKERRENIRRLVSQLVQKEYFEHVASTVEELESICNVAPTAKKAR